MAEHNQQHGRRPHFHRGRRGSDRRSSDRRTPPREHSGEAGTRDATRESAREGGVDVEQIMREIRSGIAQRHGIELTTQQIQELAARRLEAILEPRNVKPQLLEQLRKSAAAEPETPPGPAVPTFEFEDSTLYDTHRGVLRFIRKLLNPILKLFFNPTPLIDALHTQARINRELAAREVERERRQTEWNALHYELVRRVVLEMSRISLEMQALSHRIESVSAKVDFNERRVRSIEAVPSGSPSRPQPRQQEPAASVLAGGETAPPAQAAAGDTVGEGTRRRRRRRRGRRGAGGITEGMTTTEGAILEGDADADLVEGAEEDAGGIEPDVDAAAETGPASQEAAGPSAATLAPAVEQTPPFVSPAAAGAEGSPAPEPVAASDTAAPEAVVPSPPRDEPVPGDPVDHAEPGPVDR